jgi:hypothetical protein
MKLKGLREHFLMGERSSSYGLSLDGKGCKELLEDIDARISALHDSYKAGAASGSFREAFSVDVIARRLAELDLKAKDLSTCQNGLAMRLEKLERIESQLYDNGVVQRLKRLEAWMDRVCGPV